MRAVIYARVSTAEQALKGVSIPDQLAKCKQRIVENGWIQTKEYIDDGLSGHLLEERRGLQELLADARDNKIDLVVCTAFDRFARNRAAATIVREELKELLVQTYSIEAPVSPKDPKTYDPFDDDLGIMVESFSDASAEIDRNKIRRRLAAGKVAVAKSGRLPNRVPYGYKIIRSIVNNKVSREIVVNYDEAEVAKIIFDLYLKGRGVFSIAKSLNDRGRFNARGNPWMSQRIKYILKNPVYTGKVTWGWRLAESKKSKQRLNRGHTGLIEQGLHEAIIDEETFDKVQQEIKRRAGIKVFSGDDNKVERGLLTGLLKCKRCGGNGGYQRRKHHRSHINPKWNNTVTHEYICQNYRYSGQCSQRIMSAPKLEGQVMMLVNTIVKHPEAREKLLFDRSAAVGTEASSDYDRATRGIGEITRKREKQQQAYEGGYMTLQEYGIALERLRTEESQYRMVMDGYETVKRRSIMRIDDLNKFLEKIEEFDAIWEASILEEKKQFLRSIIREIRAGNDKVEIDWRF